MQTSLPQQKTNQWLYGTEVEDKNDYQGALGKVLGWWKILYLSGSCYTGFKTHWAAYSKGMQFTIYKLYLNKEWEILGMPGAMLGPCGTHRRVDFTAPQTSE